MFRVVLVSAVALHAATTSAAEVDGQIVSISETRLTLAYFDRTGRTLRTELRITPDTEIVYELTDPPY